MEDTIAAIATALGEGGIGIVRISGRQALEVAAKIFKTKKQKDINKLPGYSVHYGHVYFNDVLIDEALLIVMRNPSSYTGEDVAEIHCHGGMVAVRKVLHAALSFGARIAEPGEFTKRAFLNGRLDLTQAEAVIEIIRAKTDQAMSLAVSRLNGKFKNNINTIRTKILGIIAHVEASIDFPEDDIEELTYDKLNNLTTDALNDLHKLKLQSNQGKIYSEGVKVAIIGKPNVGKSSLLNALIGENKAIVTHIPGTTRDVVEEWLNIGGVPVKIIDTAGIREAHDLVERIGVEKSLQTMEIADIVLYVIDVEYGISEEDNEKLSKLEQDKVIVLINKLDISKERAQELEKKLRAYQTLAISAKEDIGIQELADKLKFMLTGSNLELGEDVAIGNIRHLHALDKAEQHLKDVINAISARYGYDFFAIDLRGAWEALGEITGDTISEDILSHIFENFCIGK